MPMPKPVEKPESPAPITSIAAPKPVEVSVQTNPTPETIDQTKKQMEQLTIKNAEEPKPTQQTTSTDDQVKVITTPKFIRPNNVETKSAPASGPSSKDGEPSTKPAENKGMRHGGEGRMFRRHHQRGESRHGKKILIILQII